MPTHTHFLSVLILFGTLYPVGLIQMALIWFRGEAGRNLAGRKASDRVLIVTLFGYLLLLLVVFAVYPSVMVVRPPSGVYWFGLALAIAPIIIGLEFLVGYCVLRMAGRRVRGFRIASDWRRSTLGTVLLTVGVATAEEIIFRQVWFHILSDNWRWPLLGVLALTSALYALNHLYLGAQTVVQKYIAGCVFGLLFIVSGGSVWVPLLAHGAENVLIVLRGVGS